MTKPIKKRGEIELILPFVKKGTYQTKVDYDLIQHRDLNGMVVSEHTGKETYSFIGSGTEIGITTTEKRVKKAIRRFLMKMMEAHKFSAKE